jgi:hypothetical protein
MSITMDAFIEELKKVLPLYRDELDYELTY